MYREERDSYKLDLTLNGEYIIELFSFPEAPARPSYLEAQGLRHLAFEVEDTRGGGKGVKSKRDWSRRNKDSSVYSETSSFWNEENIQ